jgi:PAS domain S-box-containing protein
VDGRANGSTHANVLDIDNWVRAELLQLFESRAAFDGSLAFVFSRDGTVRWASDGILAFLGYTRLDFEHGAIDWDKATPPEYWTLEDRYAGQLERGEETVCQYVKELIGKDGTRLAVRIHVARSVSDSEQIVMLVTELTDAKLRKG